MSYTLPALPYAHNALEPHIDAKTMEIHHGKHHQAYVNNVNAALEKHPHSKIEWGVFLFHAKREYTGVRGTCQSFEPRSIL
mgnify:CR=1 FL=1